MSAANNCSRVAACHAEAQTKAGATLTSQKASLPGTWAKPLRLPGDVDEVFTSSTLLALSTS